MNERQTILLQAVLRVLAHAAAPSPEPMIQALVQVQLGAATTVAELAETMSYCDREQLATGLPGALGRLRWSITDKGRHLLAQLNA